MRIVIGLLLFSFFVPTISHADCRFEPWAQFRTAKEAEQWLLERTGRAYTCGESVGNYPFYKPKNNPTVI